MLIQEDRRTSGVARLANSLTNGLTTGTGIFLLVVYALAVAVPFYYVVVSSLKSNQQIFGSPLALPTDPLWSNFSEALRIGGLSSALVNSIVITVGAQAVTLAIVVPAAFAIARIPGRLSTALERMFAAGLLLPTFAVLVPTFFLAVLTGLLQTRLFLILFYPATALPFGIVLLAQFMKVVPREIEESAYVDGASRWQFLTRIMIPLSRPGIVSVIIINFILFWNEYIFALVILGVQNRTIQVALPTLRSDRILDFGLISAGALIASLPVFLLYAIAQKRMQEALTGGAVKG